MRPIDIKNIIDKKVVGIWEARHDSTGHRYCHLPSGTIQRSVTTKLGILSKPHLLKWAVRIGIEWLLVEDRLERLRNEHWKDEMVTGALMASNDIKEEAGGVGTQAHNIIERYINEWIATDKRPEDITTFADMSKTDPRAIASIRAIEAVFKKHNVYPIASELLVGNSKFSAGTLDFLCVWDGKLIVVDFKTSNGIDQIGYALQVAAYVYFFKEMTKLHISGAKIIHLSKDYDKYTIYKVKNLAPAYKVFKHICSVYDWIMNTRQEKIVKDIKKVIL